MQGDTCFRHNISMFSRPLNISIIAFVALALSDPFSNPFSNMCSQNTLQDNTFIALVNEVSLDKRNVSVD